jgi:hypothetical protein
MKKHLVYAVLIGCLGTLLMFLLVYVLKLNISHPLVLPALLILAVGFSNAVIAFKLSVGLSVRTVTIRVLQTTMLSTVITNLPLLASAGYLWFLRAEQPGQISIRTGHTNFYRDAPEVAFSVFIFMLLIGLVLSVILSFVAHYFTSRRFAPTLSEKIA